MEEVVSQPWPQSAIPHSPHSSPSVRRGYYARLYPHQVQASPSAHPPTATRALTIRSALELQSSSTSGSNVIGPGSTSGVEGIGVNPPPLGLFILGRRVLTDRELRGGVQAAQLGLSSFDQSLLLESCSSATATVTAIDHSSATGSERSHIDRPCPTEAARRPPLRLLDPLLLPTPTNPSPT